MQPRETLLTYFQTGDRPTEAQFAELINSLRHRTEDPVTWSEITGKPSSFPSAWADITGKPGSFTPSAHTHPWSEVTGTPSFASVATSGLYSDLSGVPATFAPSAHTHPWSEVTGKPSFATVATSGAYSDLSGIPSTFAPGPHTHSAGEINTGTFHPARLAAGTTTDGKMIQILSGVPTWVDAPSGGGSGWALTGNAGTTGTEILGTSDNKRVRIAANGQTKLWINPGIAGGTGVPSLGSMGNAAMAVMSGASDLFGTVFGTDNVTGSGYIQAQRIDGTATAFNLHLQPSGGNVGIGNVNPSYKLDVTGSARFSTVPTITNGTTVMMLNPSTGEISKQERVQWGPYANASGGGISIGEVTNATAFAGITVGLYSTNAGVQAALFGRGDIDSPATYGLLVGGYGSRIRQARGMAFGANLDVQHTGSFLLWDQGDFATVYTTDADNQFKTQFRGGYKFQTGTTGAPATRFEILADGKVFFGNVPQYANKAAANAAIGRSGVLFEETATGHLMLS